MLDIELDFLQRFEVVGMPMAALIFWDDERMAYRDLALTG